MGTADIHSVALATEQKCLIARFSCYLPTTTSSSIVRCTPTTSCVCWFLPPRSHHSNDPMKCPVCLAADTKVTDSRLSAEGFAIRRRRECPKCGFRFSTFEEAEILNLAVIKRDGRREPYAREKVEGGLRKALEKRPVTQDDFKRLINHIERDIQHIQKPEVTSGVIGEIIMKRLKRFDTVAYIRFASVYRSFQDVATFQQELASLMRTKRPQRKKNPSRKHH